MINWYPLNVSDISEPLFIKSPESVPELELLGPVFRVSHSPKTESMNCSPVSHLLFPL